MSACLCTTQGYLSVLYQFVELGRNTISYRLQTGLDVTSPAMNHCAKYLSWVSVTPRSQEAYEALCVALDSGAELGECVRAMEKELAKKPLPGDVRREDLKVREGSTKKNRHLALFSRQ